jgi:hypothetical protein
MRILAPVFAAGKVEVYSLTVADIDRNTATSRELTADGDEVDRFAITK